MLVFVAEPNISPVRYELNVYILFRRNSVFKDLIYKISQLFTRTSNSRDKNRVQLNLITLENYFE
jgi:hypothetical protein